MTEEEYQKTIQHFNDIMYCHWIQITSFGNWKCSGCEKEFIFSAKSMKNYRYCPYCAREVQFEKTEYLK